MKKLLAILLSVVMALSCAAVFAEETAEKTTIGTISINGAFTLKCGLPEGYQITPVSMERDQIIAVLQTEDETKPMMMLSVAFDEAYSDVERMNDLDEEELAEIEKTFTDNDPTVELSYGDTGLGTRLLIAKQTEEDYDYIDFLSIYKGYMVEFVMMAPLDAEDKNLSDDQLRMCIDFLTDLDFIPAEQPSEEQTYANQRYEASVSDYDADENTVLVALKQVIVLDTDTVDALAVGDTLDIGHEQVVIETLKKDDDDGYVEINDEIELRPTADGYIPTIYENTYKDTVATLTRQIPDNLVFLDGIDPETGEPLDAPTTHTAAEFTAMLAAGGYPDFASDNVYVTLDENGELLLVERFYTPWQ